MNAQTPNFASILDEAPTEVNRPKPMPAGTYEFIVGPWTEGKSSQKGTPFVEFTLRYIDAGDDVDKEELVAAGGLEGKTIRATFYTTPDAVYRLDEFHEHCGLDITEPMSRRMRNDEVINATVMGYVGHRTAQNSDQTFTELKRTLPAD